MIDCRKVPELKDESLFAELICDFSSRSDMGVSWPRAGSRPGGGGAGRPGYWMVLMLSNRDADTGDSGDTEL